MKKAQNTKFFVGIDEAGRGPIAGPVAVGAVKISKDFKNVFPELKDGRRFLDSKKISEKKREEVFQKMALLKKDGALDFAVSMSSPKMIDGKGISRSIAQAIDRNIKKLALDPSESFIYLDGRLHAPKEFSQETLIKGDTKKLTIALASIAAKVTRDRYMIKMAKKYPKYGFEQHKGYGTRGHYGKIKQAGLSAIHRKSWIRETR